MALVDYSDSEESSDEKAHTAAQKPTLKGPSSTTSANFAIDKSNPRKIRVTLGDVPSSNASDDRDGEPAAKKPRTGGGGFSSFNEMLPAPKKETSAPNTGKVPARKVFSLKTGAEPGFNRESDTELRSFFAEQDMVIEKPGTGASEADAGLPDISMKKSPAADQLVKGNTFMFKPLSVARNTKKKKSTNGVAGQTTQTISATMSKPAATPIPAAPPPKKISLFSADQSEPQVSYTEDLEQENEGHDEFDDFDSYGNPQTTVPSSVPANNGAETLDTIASDLNLSAADRRQLFGRSGKQSGTAMNIVNFNTDREYAANEEMRSAGEQVQHNPVRAIAPGKHSLKQLVSSASGQKEALEESFAAGRRNKKEAGNKYGW